MVGCDGAPAAGAKRQRFTEKDDSPVLHVAGITRPAGPLAEAYVPVSQNAEVAKTLPSKGAGASTPAVAVDARPWHETMTETPSGRRLRSVQDWADSGVTLSSSNDQAARLLDMAAEQIVAVFGDPYGCAAAARAADPECAVPLCVLLWLRLLGSSGKRGEQDVLELLQGAHRALEARTHTPREHALVVAVKYLATGDLENTVLAIERCLVHAPSDVMLLKFHGDICLFGGFKPQMRDMIARCLSSMDPASTPMFSFVYGMQAFALGETDDTAASIRMANKALAVNAKDVWALHALLHALDFEGRAMEVSHPKP
jgi:hypothetical protein